ncbi:MAG: DegT/DnrJ/EryC1/StrS family aminotransferase [Planctomycetota bacterium]|jgi:dTDP-4-amino-4,6-dideoxygalactose transaminase
MGLDNAIPLVDLKIQHRAIGGEIAAAISRVVDSQRFILGPEVAALEEAVAGYCGAKHAIGCASGSDAVLLALWALGVGSGDEVICPAYTFFATAGSIARLGAVPVFVDIDPVTYNLDAALVQAAGRRCRRLRAIMPVHLFGQAVDVEAFLRLGREFDVPVIEDAAQAIGACDDQGERVGPRCTCACFSFFPSKNLGGYGDGGMVTTDDEALAQKIAMLRVHGEQSRYHHSEIGMNSRLDALQAAILGVKLKYLERWHEGRRANADLYDRKFAAAGAGTTEVGGVGRVGRVGGGGGDPNEGGGLPLQTPYRPAAPARHVFNQYVVRVPGEIRDALRQHLTDAGIGTAIYYPVPLHLQACFGYLGLSEGELLHSEAAARETLALPIYPELTREQIERVAGSVIDFVSRHAPVARPS